MKKLIAINGSPRKHNNTATLLEEAINGAKASGATTKLVHLYDLTYKGCISCFACKRKGAEAKCYIRDELTPVLTETLESDALVLGSPIYLSDVTGAMRSFMERLYFPFVSYGTKERSRAKKPVASAFIYTMGVNEQQLEQIGYSSLFRLNEFSMALLAGNGVKIERLISTDAYQFDRYEDYATSNIDAKHKIAIKENVFPKDCKKACELGARLIN